MQLGLAVDLADCVNLAIRTRANIDLPTKARELVARHPEADVEVTEVEETLAEQLTISETRSQTGWYAFDRLQHQ